MSGPSVIPLFSIKKNMLVPLCYGPSKETAAKVAKTPELPSDSCASLIEEVSVVNTCPKMRLTLSLNAFTSVVAESVPFQEILPVVLAALADIKTTPPSEQAMSLKVKLALEVDPAPESRADVAAVLNLYRAIAHCEGVLLVTVRVTTMSVVLPVGTLR